MKIVKLLPFLIGLLGNAIAFRLICALFVLQHWPGNQDLYLASTIAVGSLLIAVAALGYYSKASLLIFSPWKALPGMLKRLCSIGIAITLVGALFKIQHWKGADVQLVTGLSLLSVVAIGWGITVAIKVKKIDG
ncbi:MAG: hypothetical protein M0D57_03820 [Sphingobacteriales bacterium JAD_PAG50586_3]|nr:MAG: hypothetical protein M0D57_03820 [Sphingobacteriales bacterium JAD_PAG50586_3]